MQCSDNHLCDNLIYLRAYIRARVRACVRARARAQYLAEISKDIERERGLSPARFPRDIDKSSESYVYV